MDDESGRHTRRGAANTISCDCDADRDCNPHRNVRTNAFGNAHAYVVRDAHADADPHVDLNIVRIADAGRDRGDRHGDAMKYRTAFGVVE